MRSAVREAKELMKEAKDWSLWRWLMEKGRVRAEADKATETLDDLEKRAKASWNSDLKKAYRELVAQASFERNPRARHQYEKAKEEAKNVDAEIKRAAQRVEEADDEAYAARMDAEETFDEAERQMDVDLAREGAMKAITAWNLREKAIRMALVLARGTQAPKGVMHSAAVDAASRRAFVFTRAASRFAKPG
jgi:hypothetical protein